MGLLHYQEQFSHPSGEQRAKGVGTGTEDAAGTEVGSRTGAEAGAGAEEQPLLSV